MCGFMIHDGRGHFDGRLISRRGPDGQRTIGINGIFFTHYLLHITGAKVYQPFVSKDGNIVALYNGEIYNHDFHLSDGENIIPLYQQYGDQFPCFLDGEYAIVLFDFSRDLAFYITDPFATKPLWRNGVYAASYQSGAGAGAHKVRANTIETVRISTGKTIDVLSEYHYFDFRQLGDDYENCINAFEMAISKRKKGRCFIGLSSGYDSGAIACELQRQGCDFKSYSIEASEDKKILVKRSHHHPIECIASFDFVAQQKHLLMHAEDFNYAIEYDHGLCTESYKKDYAAWGLSHICMLGAGEGRRVYISGTGADEILCDYSLIPMQSQFKGVWPEKLSPWRNFYDSCMYSYLGKEECVAGSWGIETRYPFLDKHFVQAFLSLKPELKMRYYKAPLHAYLERRNFPFKLNRKIGFSI